MIFMKHRRSLLSLILLVLLLIGCVKQTFEPVDLPQQDNDIPLQKEKEVKLPKESKIAVYPTPAIWDREWITTVDQVVDPMGRYDFRGYDVSNLDLSKIMMDRFMFDTQTKWPAKLPDNFDLNRIIDYGKQPGLSIEAVHKQGFTGNGVNVGIIDGRLLVDHQEFKENVAVYEEIGTMEGPAHYHGTPITSILTGNTVGVAPDANIYYVAYLASNELSNIENLIQAVYRMIAINRELPAEEKIRVLSISSGWNPDDEHGVQMNEAIEQAKQEGMFVVSARLHDTDGLYFGGAERHVMDDPNESSSFQIFTYLDEYQLAKEILMVPKDGRWMASNIGQNEYVMYSMGAWSMAIPYISGVYALACEAYPKIDPSLFWQLAIETGDDFDQTAIHKDYQNKKVKLINPLKLIQALSQRK